MVFDQKMWNQGPYSQHYIFFVTYESPKLARAFDYTSSEWFACQKYSILLAQSQVTKKRKVLWIHNT
jgi:hypothetical protein